MTGVGHNVLLLAALLLFVNPCVLERVERENSLDLHERDDDGGELTQDTSKNQQTLTKHKTEDGPDSNVLQKDGQSVSKYNDTDTYSNETLHSTTPTAKPTTPTPPTVKPILPVQTGVKAQEEEQSSGLTIFFSLLVIGICIILVHLLIKFKLHFLPESVAVVSLGILMGGFIKIIEFQELANWKEEEMFRIQYVLLYTYHLGWIPYTRLRTIGGVFPASRPVIEVVPMMVSVTAVVLSVGPGSFPCTAVNIFPLSFLLNFFRDHKITPKMMFIMWFSGLRGAIPHALSLHLAWSPLEKLHDWHHHHHHRIFHHPPPGAALRHPSASWTLRTANATYNKKDINLSKTEKMVIPLSQEHLSELDGGGVRLRSTTDKI
ncbi:sodium/hydrogen exchanger 8 [Lates japonicus]|uniref:Sodium/hydrogen exchanger 8 n=1 Tax=Lates japonicus TaxID=270547 RepID=A0AAD3M2A0_LATJO|nr:sodium/hydrogen exchanger 8 [Lates japonicus]